MSILRTIAMFIYLFGYMILHYGILSPPPPPPPPPRPRPPPPEIPPPWSRS